MTRWKVGRQRSGVKEAHVTKSVRDMLKLLKIPHFKNFATLGSKRGVSDIIGVLPKNGRALFLELKAPGKRPTPDQVQFLTEMAAAGALAFWADNARDVVARLAAEGYMPARMIAPQLGINKQEAAPSATISPAPLAQDQDAGGG